MITHPTCLRGRTVVITGAARGIGRATASAFVREGARVFPCDLDAGALDEACHAIGIPRTDAIVLDVADGEAFRAAMNRVESLAGAVDVLVNNAGIMLLGGFLEQTPEQDARQLAVNLHGVINGMRAVLPAMRARGRGHIINLASLGGRIATPHACVYCATKFAVVGLTEGVRREYQGAGIDFSYVLPAIVDTELASGVAPPRFAPAVTPADVAAAIVRTTRDKRVEVYVPEIAGLAARLLPLAVPRPVDDWLFGRLGGGETFSRVDRGARAAYARRSEGDGGAPSGRGERGGER